MKCKQDNTVIPIFNKNFAEHLERGALAVQLSEAQVTIKALTDTIYSLQDRIGELLTSNKFYRDKLEAFGIDPDKSYAVGYASAPTTNETKAKPIKVKVKVRRCCPHRDIFTELFLENTKDGTF